MIKERLKKLLIPKRDVLYILIFALFIKSISNMNTNKIWVFRLRIMKNNN